MNDVPEGHGQATAVTEAPKEPLERRLLALDALSKLARQFSAKPDFEHLMSVLLMTLCGQFSVGNAVAILKRPHSGSCGRTFFATGRFRNSSGLAGLDISSESCSALMGGQSSCKLKDLDLSDRHSGIIPVLREQGVGLVCPLIHDDDLLGIIGIGDRVTGKEFDREEVELIVAIIDTITPFLANTYLFWEIGRLNTWYLDILNSVKQGVFVFDSFNRLKKINTAGLDIYQAFARGISDAGEICGKPIEQVFPPHAFGGLVPDVMTSKIAGGSAGAKSFVARGKNANRVYNLRLSESREGDENGTDLIMTLDDITAQREAEERLFNLQQLADRGVMASAISHELRNFLGLLLGGLELTQVAITRGEGDKADEHIDKLKSTVENLEKFASGLMDYNKFEVDKQTSSLNGVISDVISFISGQQHFKDITITADLDTDLPEVMIDADKIAQLLLNLLHNGADAILEAGRSDGEIMVGTFSDESEVVLIISDNGAGVSPDIKDSLFKKRLTTKKHGHGYGLVTCASIIEGHNATVTVDSEPNEGSVFTFRFPV
ncbi:MAG: ATP-binding protein [bacterium]|jgi:signal transduction histidine kinase